MADPYAQYVTTLISAEPSDGAFWLNDLSYTDATWFPGNYRVTANPKFGTYSISGSVFGIGCGSINRASTRFQGTNPGCIEFVVRLANVTTKQCLYSVGWNNGGVAASYQMLFVEGGQIKFHIDDGATFSIAGGTVVANTWYHIAIVRDGDTMTIYVDGTSVASGALTAQYSFSSGSNTPTMFFQTSNRAVNVSTVVTSNSVVAGSQIDEVRVTNGHPRYTADFLPPSTRHELPDITHDANNCAAYEPVSHKAVVITLSDTPTGQKFFVSDRGNADYYPYGANLTIAAMNEPISGMKAMYLQTTSAASAGYWAGPSAPWEVDTVTYPEFFLEAMVSWSSSAASTNGVSAIFVGGYLQVGCNGNTGGIGFGFGGVSPMALNDGRGKHIMLRRTGSSAYTMFINGARVGTASATYSNTTDQIRFFYSKDGTYRVSGLTGNFRFATGLPAEYAANKFKPPTVAPVGYADNYDELRNYTVLAMPLMYGLANPLIDYAGHTTYTVAQSPNTILEGIGQKAVGGFSYYDDNVYKFVPHHADFVVGANNFCLEFCGVVHQGTADYWVTSLTVGDIDGATNTIKNGMAVQVWYVPLVAGSFYFAVTLYDASGTSTQVIYTTLTNATNPRRIAVCRDGNDVKAYVWDETDYFDLGATPTVYTNPGVFAGYNIALGNVPGNDKAFRMYNYRPGGMHLTNVRMTNGHRRYPDYKKPPFVLPKHGLEDISGTVLDTNGMPAQRRVVALRRSSMQPIGETLSDPSTGAFSIKTYGYYEHTVMALDNDQNAIVYDHVIPQTT